MGLQNKALLDQTDMPSPQMRAKLDNPRALSYQRKVAWITITLPTLGFIIAIASIPFLGLSWQAVVAWAFMHLVGMLGITVGYHRQFAHRSFKTNQFGKALLIIMGATAAEGPVIHWVSNHRRHHEFSDKEGDIHSPHAPPSDDASWLQGFWHAHVSWMLSADIANPARYAADLLRDPLVTRINRQYPMWVLASIALPALLVGWSTGSWTGVLQGALWGGLVRIFTVHHATWSVNSVCHLFGARPFNTKEHSANNVWLALPTAGEAWHNCHHAFPTSARFGLKWWQFDVGYVFILMLRALNMARDIHVPSAEAMAAKTVN